LMRDRAIREYTGRSTQLLDLLLTSSDMSALARRAELVSRVQEVDADLVRTYARTRQELEDKGDALAQLVAGRQRQLGQLQVEQAEVDAETKKISDGLTFIEKGRSIALGGFVFPVQPPYKYWDSWLAPRMVGTALFHYHQGIDIFAPQGTPLRACVRGVVARIGTDRLGGTKLWIVGVDGSRYYYAHLSGYVEGLTEGMVVAAGQTVGYVGNTGNAAGGPTHLHFEIHPAGGDAINPYP